MIALRDRPVLVGSAVAGAGIFLVVDVLVSATILWCGLEAGSVLAR